MISEIRNRRVAEIVNGTPDIDLAGFRLDITNSAIILDCVMKSLAVPLQGTAAGLKNSCAIFRGEKRC